MGNAEMAAAIGTVFAQPDAEHVHTRLDVIAGIIALPISPGRGDAAAGGRRPARLHRLPVGHSRKIWSTNPLERLNKEIKRRTDVVGWGHLPLAGDFPNPATLLRLAGAVLVEARDEWQVSDRRYLAEGSMAQFNRPTPAKEVAQPALTPS
jgi:transposase-like protein